MPSDHAQSERAVARLPGKAALVTGGASGIGEAIAARLKAEGAQVFIVDVDEENGSATAARLGVAFISLDVRSAAGWRDAIARVRRECGRIDALVNNAGIVSHAPIDEVSPEAWERVLAVNLTGAMLGCQAAIAAMRENSPSGGAILNVSSSVALLGLAGDVAYTASKSGLVGLTRSAAARCARQGWNIRVNSLHPGPTATAITRRSAESDPGVLTRYGAMTPMNRMADPAEIGGLAAFLLSDDASFCTGGAYTVDGGLTATHPTG